jgi:hypothetical protein
MGFGAVMAFLFGWGTNNAFLWHSFLLSRKAVSMVSLSFFRDSLGLVVKEPRLFLPKLGIAVLYGALMLQIARFSLQIIPVSVISVHWTALEAGQLLLESIGFLFLVLLVMIADVWISSWYPKLVSDYRENRTLSFQKAVQESNARFRVVLPSVLGLELLIAFLLGIFLNAALFFLPSNGFWFGVLSGTAIVFLVTVLLYPLLSVAVLEKKPVWGSIRRTLSLSRKNWRVFSLVSVLQFAVSLLNFLLAFLAEKPEFLALFWIFRIGLALIATYNATLNPSAYFAVLGKEEK